MQLVTPPLVILFVLGAGWYLISGKNTKTASDVAWSIASYVLFVFISGGIAIAYLGQWLSLTWKGLMQTPKNPWNLSIQEKNTIHLLSADFQTSIPIAAVKKFTYVYDDNWDQMRGMEDSGLIVHLRKGGRIRIPGSSAGFTEGLSKLRAEHEVESIGLT